MPELSWKRKMPRNTLTTKWNCSRRFSGILHNTFHDLDQRKYLYAPLSRCFYPKSTFLVCVCDPCGNWIYDLGVARATLLPTAPHIDRWCIWYILSKRVGVKITRTQSFSRSSHMVRTGKTLGPHSALTYSVWPWRQFAEACGQALDVNERLIKEDQLEYQEEMRAHYRDMLTELSTVMNEQVCGTRPETLKLLFL